MSKNDIEKKIEELINSMRPTLMGMVDNATTSEMATNNIMNFVSGKVTTAARGYLSTLYYELEESTLEEDIFQNPVNANKFYKLDLKKKITDVYKFNVTELNSYKKGISFQEINKIYATTGGAVGSAAVGGILLKALSGAIEIPFIVIIAGSVVCALAGGGLTYTTYVPNENKKRYKHALNMFLNNLKNELCKWIKSIIVFYNEQVEQLKASFKGETNNE